MTEWCISEDQKKIRCPSHLLIQQGGINAQHFVTKYWTCGKRICTGILSYLMFVFQNGMDTVCKWTLLKVGVCTEVIGRQ